MQESPGNRATITSSQDPTAAEVQERGQLSMRRPQSQGSQPLVPNERDPSGTAADVTESTRTDKSREIREKFQDIFSVNNPDSKLETAYNDEVNVAGRFSYPNHVAFFREIGAPEFIVQTLEYGHKSKLTGPVPAYERRNNLSFYQNEAFGVKEVKRLISLGRVEVVTEKPHIVNPLTVVNQRTKSRLILDCTYLNKYVEVPEFKYENEKVALDFFKRGCYMIGWDLRDGYNHIMIHPNFRTYLGFKISLDGKMTYCRYVVGPFGLRDLPWLFSKIFRVLIKRWRGLGLKAIMFLDDGINFSSSYEEGEAESELIKADLQKAGAIYSIKKSQWVPKQQIQWVGFNWDSNRGHLSIAEHRVEKILSTSSSLLSAPTCHVKALASFVGQVISTMQVTGNMAKLMTRFCQQKIAFGGTWEDSILLEEPIINEIKFWQSNIIRLNNWFCKGLNKPSIIKVVSSDASDSGCGAVCSVSGLISARLFSPEERLSHSTKRELLGGLHALESFLPVIQQSFVKLRLDNQSSARIIDSGSMKEDLHAIAIDIFELCFKNGIELELEWIPRECNEAADLASRTANIVDIDDWQITPAFFSILNNMWGPLSIDAFANSHNKNLDRFYSFFHSPGCEGVNAFAYDWSKEFCLIVPPISVVGKALNHLKLCRAKAVLVVPEWPSSYFWPILLRDFRNCIIQTFTARGDKVLCHGFNTNSLLGSKVFKGNVKAFLINCG